MENNTSENKWYTHLGRRPRSFEPAAGLYSQILSAKKPSPTCETEQEPISQNPVPNNFFVETNIPSLPEEAKVADKGEPYYNLSHTDLPCCSMIQLNINGNPPAKVLRQAIENHHLSYNGGRRVFMVNVLIPGEEPLQKALLDYGFVEVAEFSRRHRYIQDVRIKMYLYEPESTPAGIVRNSEGFSKNKIVLPKS
jgi:hypothetical protein